MQSVAASNDFNKWGSRCSIGIRGAIPESQQLNYIVNANVACPEKIPRG